MTHDDAMMLMEEDPWYMTGIHIDTAVSMAMPNVTAYQGMVGGPAAFETAE
jgi:hypothetical protein